MLFGKHINRYYLRYLHYLLGGIAALVMVDYFQLLVPELYRQVINGVNNGFVTVEGVQYAFDMDFLLDKICLPMIAVIVCMVIGRFAWRICFFGSAIKVETDLRSRMFDRCKDLSQRYYQENKVGNLMSLFTNDIDTVQECFGVGLLTLCDAALLLTMAIIKMVRMNPILTLLSLIPMMFLLAMSAIIGHRITVKWDARQEAFSSLSDFAQENFSGIAVVKAFVRETVELMAFRKLNEVNEKTNVDYVRLSTIMRILVTLFVESIICVILGYGGYLVYHGVFNAGQLVEFIGYFTAIVWPIMGMSDLIDMRARGKASIDRIAELLDAVPDITDREDAEKIDVLSGTVECRGLTFRYPGADYDSLSDVSFTINAGENVGIIGRTGAGKTTLVDLLLRTYNVPNGMIFLDGYDINSLPVKTVRGNAAYVPQDNFLFSDTIENNIAFAAGNGKSERESDEVTNAAKMSDVHDNIMGFTDGYKTMLGERGVTVSGGQKQRISIARALMKDAPLLILDDSVSAVDVSTEKVILSNLRDIRKGKTTILIAHRISTIENMDKLLFLDEGKLIAVGTHAQLYNDCQAYRDMVDAQKLDDEAAKEGGKSNA